MGRKVSRRERAREEEEREGSEEKERRNHCSKNVTDPVVRFVYKGLKSLT